MKKMLSPEVIQALKAKVYLLYGQNYSKVGLLSNYQLEAVQKCNSSEYSNPAKKVKIISTEEEGSSFSSNPLAYSGCSWKINVVLSTN